MLKAILWDNDGVLVDTERLFYEANRDLLAQYGVELTSQHFFDWYLHDNCGAWHLLEDPNPQRIEQWRQERNRIYSQKLQTDAELLIPGMDEVVSRFSRELRMGIVTSSYPEHFYQIHDRLDLLPHFEMVLTCEDYGQSKPSPEPYLLAMEKMGLSADECLVIEDSPRGLAAAKAAGIRCVIMSHPLTRQHAFDGALAVVNGPDELGATIADLF